MLPLPVSEQKEPRLALGERLPAPPGAPWRSGPPFSTAAVAAAIGECEGVVLGSASKAEPLVLAASSSSSKDAEAGAGMFVVGPFPKGGGRWSLQTGRKHGGQGGGLWGVIGGLAGRRGAIGGSPFPARYSQGLWLWSVAQSDSRRETSGCNERVRLVQLLQGTQAS